MIDMNMRNRQMQVFEDTLRFCEREQELVNRIAMSREHSVLWRNIEETEQLERHAVRNLPNTKRYVDSCKVICSEQRALDLVRFLKEEDCTRRTGVLSLSFSACFGGNVLRGGAGWEETLCRCTTLYPCLEKIDTQQVCRNMHNDFVDETCVYVPDVVCLSSGEMDCERMERHNWFSSDIIMYTSESVRDCAFVNHQDDAIDILRGTQQEYEKLQYRSLEVMLRMAVKQNLDELVIPVSLYMWDGCGLEDIIVRMKTALQKYIYFFRAVHLVFA